MADQFNYDVFLSHSSKDKDIVRAVAERLRADGLRVWFDSWELRPGDSIPAKIEEGLEASRVLVLCMSANAFGSDWAQLEAGTFRFRDPLNRERRFIPLRLDAAPIKGSLAQFLYINWLPEVREQEYAKLLNACKPSASQVEISQTVQERDTQFQSPAPNIVCLGENYVNVELNRHEVFRQSEHTECVLKAITARFHNKPNLPQKVGSINNVTARISYYSLNWPERLDCEIEYGCWLNEESPHVSFKLDTTQYLIIGVLERNPTGGFKPEFRVYGNSLDKNASLTRFVYSKCPGFRIRVHLTIGEYGELGREHDFELKLQTHGNKCNPNFEYLTKRRKQERRESLAIQLRKLITDGEKFILEPKDVTDWNRFCWDANTWRHKVEMILNENMGTPHSIRFLDVSRLLPINQIAREGGNQFLDEFRARHDNLKEIAVELEGGHGEHLVAMEQKFDSSVVKEQAGQMQIKSQLVIDNESRELMAVHHAGFIVAEAGQIYRGYTNSDHGIDGEIEFKDDQGRATGKRLYLQLKSGDSYLTKRQRDGAEVFQIKNARWAEYWQQQAYPVLLVIRTSDGEIRWMDVREYLKRAQQPVKQIAFAGERFDVMSVRRWRDRMLGQGLL